MASTTIDTTFPLPNSSHQIPQLGFGVYLSPQDTCVKSCLEALKSGYRHIDTAQYYANESEVGQAVKQSGLSRSSLFLTSKILSPAGSADATYQKIVDSVKKLDDGANGYADLFLVHSPNAGAGPREEMWTALVRAKKEGIVREIGVSNYGIGHIEELKTIGDVWPPAVNQIELHPWCQQREVVEYCQKNDIVVSAYSPLVRNEKAKDKTLVSICEKHGVGPNQVLVRWSLQKGFVPLPKSDTPDRIKSNADVFGFKLDDDDMKKLDGLDQGAAGAIVQAVQNK